MTPEQGERASFHRGLQQGIETDGFFPQNDELGQEDHMHARLWELVAENAIEPQDAEAVFSSWIQSRRPDTHIFTVPQRVPHPFYE